MKKKCSKSTIILFYQSMGCCSSEQKDKPNKPPPTTGEFYEELCFVGDVLAVIPSSMMIKLPHRLIGLMTFKTKEGEICIGTGILISPDLVLSVAHNVFDFENKAYYRDHRFYMGLCGKAEKFYEVDRFFIPEVYKEKNGPEYDYALLKLKEKANAYTFIPLNGNFAYLSDQQDVGIFGYSHQGQNWKRLDPADPYKFEAKQNGIQLNKRYRNDCLEISQNNPGRLNHKISTYKGESGAPIVLLNGKDISIVGIHKGGDPQLQVNVGRLITPELIKQLKKEAALLGAEPFINESDTPISQPISPLPPSIDIPSTIIEPLGKDPTFCQQAIINYRNSLKIKEDWDTWNNLGVTYSDMRQYMGAIECYSKAIALAPQQWEPYNNKANAHFHAKMYESALSNYEQAIKIHPTHEAYYNQGIIFSTLKKHQLALQSFRKVVQLKPTHVLARFKLAISQYFLKKFSEAVSNLEEVIKLQPDNGDAYSAMGTILLMQKNYIRAVEQFKTAIVNGVENSNISYQMGIAYSELSQTEKNSRYLQDAVKEFRKAIAQDSRHVQAHRNLAIALSKLNQLQEAISAFDSLLKLEKKAAHYFNKGIAQFSLEKYFEAILTFGEATKLEPNYSSAHFNKGVALSKLGRDQEAADSFSKAVRYDPNNIQAHFNLASTLQKLGLSNEAEEQFLEVIKLDQYNDQAFFNLGCIRSSSNRYEEALESFTNSSLIKKRSETFYNIGVTLQKLGRYLEAEKYLQMK